MAPFDYIVVGAGSAGCVVASRLSCGGARSVLLLEAGGSERRLWIGLPVGYGRTFSDPRINWMYQTEADPALGGRRAFWPRGKVIGGSGSINALVYARGLPQDFDHWRELGNPGWGFSDVLPCFQRVERTLQISDVARDAHPLCQAYIEACRTLGFPVTADFNGEHGEGVGIYRITTRGGLRDSSARSYLRPALRRGSLMLALRAQALRVLIEQGRAGGVQYRQGGRTLEARARRAVILCAGAINTPQLLQLSGVGPRALLERHGIATLVDNPAVGRHLQDHLAVSYIFRSSVPTLNQQLLPWRGRMRAAARYLFERRGPLAMSVNQAGGFVRSDATQTHANLQLYFNPISYTTSSASGRRLLNPDPFPAFLLSFNACRPSSRGYLEIRSSDPFETPAIHTNALATEHDVAEVIAGTALLRRIAATAPLRGYIESELLPGSGIASDAQRLLDFRERAGTVFHPVGTCRMGPDASEAVVDARLRVHGVAGLRIVDASVFPGMTSGNANAPTLMVAENGSALIAEDE